MIHNELRETQRRLVETRDEHKHAQDAQATRQLGTLEPTQRPHPIDSARIGALTGLRDLC